MRAARIVSCVVLLGAWVGFAAAAPPAALPRSAKPAGRAVVDNSQRIDGNNVSMFVTNTGSFAYDKTTGNSGLEFPKGTGKTAVFAAGLWVGARVSGTTRVAVAEYSDEYGPGSAVGGVPDDPNLPEYKVYKLNRFYADPTERDAALADYNAGAVPHGAPVVTVNGDGTLGGGMLGDQMTWAVYNDLDATNHTNRAGSTAPLGIEVQQTTFAFNRQGALGNTVFMRYKFINRGTDVLDSMFVSQWSDPDLGGATDDLVGCDPNLGLGFVYNATNNDEQYVSSVPAVGFDFFQGPIVPGDTLGMTSFNKYINGTDPNTFQKSYNFMLGLNADGSVIVNPVTGLPTSFQVSGDPVTGAGWLDANPADRRLMLSSGPFKMNPGDQQEVTVAIVIGQSKNRLASISLMKFYDTFAQAAFEANFNLPSPPTSPLVTATPRNGTVYLAWDTRAESYSGGPYAFEGYVVYQGASVAGPWTRVATYDKVDGITTVLDEDFNEEQGLILPIGKAFGQDVGLRYSLELDADAVRGGPLHNGTPYYYSINAYAVGIGEFPQVLESAFTPVTVVPQTPAGGTDWASAATSAATHTGPSTDQVSVTVVDPDKVIDANYLMGFKPACGTCTEVVWYLVRTVGAAVDTVLNNQTDFSGDDSYPVVDGVQPKVVSFPLGELARVTYDDVGPTAQALDGVDVGLRFFAGGADYSADLFGSSIASHSTNTHNVEIRFNGTQYAYRYLRTLEPPVTGSRVYSIQDYVPVPFTVWDIDANIQLNAAFLENAGPPASPNMNGQWDPDDSGTGGREIVWVMDDAYDGDNTPNAAYMPGGDPAFHDALAGNLPQRYALWSYRTSAGAVIDPGDKISFTTSIPSNAADQFTFSTTAPNRSNATLAKSELDLIKAVPNPYFNHSVYELNQFNRQLKFTHLPQRCTIRLFNLAGDLIRVLEKNDASSQFTWDLETNRGLPVGSGIYVFHVDAPGVGTHVGKVAVFMEKERLNNF